MMVMIMIMILTQQRVLQEATENVIESGPCRQVATQLVKLHVNSKFLRQSLDDLGHSVTVR